MSWLWQSCFRERERLSAMIYFVYINLFIAVILSRRFPKTELSTAIFEYFVRDYYEKYMASQGCCILRNSVSNAFVNLVNSFCSVCANHLVPLSFV